MKIFIGTDHGGFNAKEVLKHYLSSQGHSVDDKGAYEYNPDDDYPDYAFEVAEAVVNNLDSKGIILCKSSIGVCVAANKVKGIFASSPRTAEEAKTDIEHHNSNVLCLSAEHIDLDVMKEILDTWLNSEFKGERHERRINKIKNYELTH